MVTKQRSNMSLRALLVVALVLAGLSPLLAAVAADDVAEKKAPCPPGKSPKPPKLPKTPKPPKAPKAPKPPKAPKAPKPPKPPNPPPRRSGGVARCKDRTYRFCYNVPIPCPTVCPHNCQVNCVTCRPFCGCDLVGSQCQDPRFIGADGIAFYFHGKKDRDFCLVSDADFHVNAHFVGKRNPAVSRDFTWVQSISILFGTHKLYLGAKKTRVWDDASDRIAVSFDGGLVVLKEEEGAVWRTTATDPEVSIVRTSDVNGVSVDVAGMLKVSAKVVPVTGEESRVHNYGITEDDCMAHLELGFKFYSLTDDVHGVLGQTYRDDYVSRLKVSASNPLMGGEPKYVTSSLFSSDCEVSRFGRASNGTNVGAAALSDARCRSGWNGGGIYCKR